MKNILSALTLATVLLACAEPAVAAQRRYGTVAFNTVQIVGNFSADIVVTTGSGVVADGDTDVLERLEVNVNNGILTIKEKRLYNERSSTDRASRPVKLSIRATGLRQVMLNGNGRVTVAGLREQSAALFVRGNGEITASGMNVANASSQIDGAGRIVMSGQTQALNASLQGAASIDASALIVRDLEVNAQGTGRGSFTANRRATVNASGLGEIDVKGTAACVVKNTGNGDVYCGK